MKYHVTLRSVYSSVYMSRVVTAHSITEAIESAEAANAGHISISAFLLP